MIEKNRLIQIVLSDSIEQHQGVDGQLVNKIVQPALSFGVSFLPSVLSFHVIILTTGFNFENEMDFNFKLTDSKDELIQENPLKKTPSINGNFDNFNINVEVKNAEIMDKGLYKIKVCIDGVEAERNFKITADKVYEYKLKE